VSEYRINLDVFSGPMDLLLYLVRKEEVDIYDISITGITAQYLGYLDMLKSLDIDVAGDFLVMAATLMQIKSAMLLPKVDLGDGDSEQLIDPRRELIRQLLEYKQFKDAANRLGEAAHEQVGRFSRPDTMLARLKPDSEPEVDVEQVSVWDLLEAFDELMKATGSYQDISHISDDTPVDIYQIEILDRVQNEGGLAFEKLFEGIKNRLVKIGMFIALLELIRANLIGVGQKKDAGHAWKNSYYIESLTDEPAERAVHKAFADNAPIPVAEIPAAEADRGEENAFQRQHPAAGRDVEGT